MFDAQYKQAGMSAIVVYGMYRSKYTRLPVGISVCRHHVLYGVPSNPISVLAV